MIKRNLFAAAALIAATTMASSAFAGSCPRDMKKIDAALAKNPSISAMAMSEVAELRAKGEALHKAGDHKASVAALHAAEKLLGIGM